MGRPLSFAVLPAAFAATDADSVRVEELEEFSVTALSGANARIAADGSVSIDAAAAGLAASAFGETDLIFGLLGSAGVATVSDYSSGVSIDGMDYANNAYLINGVPVGFRIISVESSPRSTPRPLSSCLSMEKHSSHRVGGLSRRNRGDLCRRSFSEQDFGYGQRRHDGVVGYAAPAVGRQDHGHGFRPRQLY